jgi:hypothetical protein
LQRESLRENEEDSGIETSDVIQQMPLLPPLANISKSINFRPMLIILLCNGLTWVDRSEDAEGEDAVGKGAISAFRE